MSDLKWTDQNQKAAEEAFTTFDKKGEGQIRVNDIAPCMSAMNQKVKPDWLEQMEDTIDEEGTGYISILDFVKLVQAKMQADIDERELKEIFRVLDKEKKGEVNVNEIRWILKSLGDDMTEEDIDDMILDVDTDGSGWVDYEEFKKLMLG